MSEMSEGNGAGIHGLPITTVRAANGHFMPGTIPPRNHGRPRGSKNFERELTKVSSRLAKRYVEKALRGCVPLLLDSRKYFLPSEERLPTDEAPLLIFAAPGSQVTVDAPTLSVRGANGHV